MPTMQQLPQTLVVDPEDEVLLAQDGETRVVAVATLLGGTQARLTLAPGTLLGRAGYFPGGPEPIAVGNGLVVDQGIISADANALAFIESPAFTGTPTAPTPPNGDSSDALATTAFVQANLPRLTIGGDLVGGGSGDIIVSLPTITAAGTYTAVTVNTKGLVTSGATLAASDIVTALGYTPYNAANPAAFTTAASLDSFPALAYGALFDGVHDDQPAIAAAIAAAHAAGGGTVVLPAGKGCLATTLVQPYNNVHIVGAGVPNVSHNTTSTYDIGTALTWIGAVGGTMAIVGPAQNLVNGRGVSNADLRGVLFDCRNVAGIGLVVASVTHSKFDVGYYQPLVCGLKITTSWLQSKTAANAPTNEVNDTQHNLWRIVGYTVNFATTTLTVAAAGASVAPVGSTANFYPGLQVKIGSGLYIVQSLTASALTLSTPLAAADSAAGTAVNPAPRGVWVHGLTTADLPSGYFPSGASSYPQLWIGNTSLNQFESVTLLHYNGGDGFTYGYSDHNHVDKLTVYSLATGYGLVFDGSAGLSQHSGENTVRYCSVGRAIAKGTTSYPNNSGGSLPGSAFAAQNCAIACLDTNNGNPAPIIEPGATLRYATDTDMVFSTRLIAPIVYDAPWEPITGTYVTSPTTSLNVVNNSSDHLALLTALGGYAWSFNVDGGQGNLRIYPTGASASATMLLGSGSSTVSSLGKLLAGNGLSVTGATSIGGALSAASAAIGGALSAATLSANAASMSGAMSAGTLSVSGGASAASATVSGAVTAATLSAGAASVSGAMSAGTLSVTGGATAASATVSGAVTAAMLSAGAASVSGAMSAGTLSVSGGASAASVTVSGAVSAATVSVSGGVNIASAVVSGALTAATLAAGMASVSGGLSVPTPPATDSSASAANTAWVAAKGFVQQVATIAALRAIPFATLADGATMMLDAYATRGDGGAGLFVWTASSTAADNGGIVVNPTANSGAGRWIRQLADGRVTPQMFGAKGDGANNDTAAFAAALLAGPVVVPNGTYRIANLVIPNGAWMEGGAGLGYSGDVGTPPGSGQKAAVVTPVLLAVAGTNSCILNVYGCNDATLKGLFIDGGVNTPTCDGVSSGSTQLMMERVTVVRCINGLGSVSNTDLYTHVATLINCEFANNTTGIANLIDTAMIGGAVSANTTGVNLGSGANANSFIAVRFEWSINDGVAGYNAASNVFCGGLFDRNAWRAVNLGTGCKDWTFVGVQFARNGSNNVYPNNSHIALNGTTSVFLNGCISRTGTNDDGTGTLSPAYFANYINTNALVTISGCDVSGYVTGFSFGAAPTAYVQRDNFGAGDTFVNAARPYIGGGVVAQTLFTKAAAAIAPGASTTIAMSQSPITTNYSTTTRALHVTAVNNNSPYQSCSARIALGFYRDTAVHAPSGSSAFGETGGTGLITWGGSGKLQLSAAAVASDGSTWTLGILNGGSADGSNWSVFAELH
jgi:hypothetical protein